MTTRTTSPAWSGRDTMLNAIAQVGNAVVQLHGPLPNDVAEAYRRLLATIQAHERQAGADERT